MIPGNPNFALDNENSFTGRLNLLWKPTSRLSIDIWGEGSPTTHTPRGPRTSSTPTPIRARSARTTPASTASAPISARGTISYDLGWATLKSISSYQSTLVKTPEDVDLLNYSTAIALYGVHDRSPYYYRHPTAVTTEVDLVSPRGGKLEWIVGAFYLHQSSDQAFIEYQQTSPGLPMPVYLNPTPAQLGQIFGNQLSFESQSVERHTSYSAYGQGVYHLTSNLRITAGARYSWDTSTGDVATYYSSPVKLQTSFSALTGKIGLDYDLAPDNLVYITYSDGVKPAAPTSIRSRSRSPASSGTRRCRNWRSGPRTSSSTAACGSTSTPSTTTTATCRSIPKTRCPTRAGSPTSAGCTPTASRPTSARCCPTPSGWTATSRPWTGGWTATPS